MEIKTKIGHLFQLAIITSSLMGSSAWATIDLDKTTIDNVEYYKIANGADLVTFASGVNGGENDANAVLTDNITLNSNVLNANGELNSTPSTSWTPIGTSSKPYKGNFNGKGYKISGLYYKYTRTGIFSQKCTSYIGLFGYISNATIENVNLEDSYFGGLIQYVGGICGYNDGGKITNCSNSGTVGSIYTGDSNDYVGGICGYNASSGAISNCSNAGSITASKEDAGGICGHNTGTIINVYNIGSVKGDSYVGGVCGSNEGTVKNCYSKGSVTGTGTKGSVDSVCGKVGTMESCYYLSDTDDGNGAMTRDQFASGELAIILQMWVDNNKSTYSKLTLSNWTQINGTNSTNKTPAFGDNGIEYVRANTSNNWGTLCLPYVYSYTYDSSTLSLYDVKEVVNSELVLSPADSVTPGKPVVYYYTGADDSLKVTIPSTKFGTVATLTANNSLLNGVYEYSTVSGTTNYYLKDDVFYKSAGSIIANPFRAYVTVPAVASAPKGLKSLALSVDNNASNDSEEEAATVTESHIVAIYNINGQQVGKMDRGGIYVVKMSDGSTKKVRITE